MNKFKVGDRVKIPIEFIKYRDQAGGEIATTGTIDFVDPRDENMTYYVKRDDDLQYMWYRGYELDLIKEDNKENEGMTKDAYMAFHKDFCDKMGSITKAKNADYTGSADSPFANFTRVESLGICSTEQGFLTRMTDKLCRITSFVQQGTLQVKDESVQDTLHDLANYCALFSGYIESLKEKK